MLNKSSLVRVATIMINMDMCAQICMQGPSLAVFRCMFKILNRLDLTFVYVRCATLAAEPRASLQLLEIR